MQVWVALEQETFLGLSGPRPKRLLAPSLIDFRGNPGIRALYQAIGRPFASSRPFASIEDLHGHSLYTSACLWSLEVPEESPPQPSLVETDEKTKQDGEELYHPGRNYYKNPRVRKICVRNSGAGNGCANFMDTWKNAFFLQEKPCP